MPLSSLRIVDFSDRELLHVVHDAIDSKGWANSHEIADRVGLKAKNPGTNVGVRLARMKALGAAENGPEGPYWRPTPEGEKLMSGEIAASLAKSLNKMDPGQIIMLTRWLGGQYHSLGSDSLGAFIRREFTYGTFAPGGNGSRV